MIDTDIIKREYHREGATKAHYNREQIKADVLESPRNTRKDAK